MPIVEVPLYEYPTDVVNLTLLELLTDDMFDIYFPKSSSIVEHDDPQLVDIQNTRVPLR